MATLASLTLSAAMFVMCNRQLRVLSKQQRSRLNDLQALKTVLANVDAVALLLRSRPNTELRRLLDGSGVPHMSERELALLQSVLQHKLPQGQRVGLQPAPAR